MAFGTPHRLVGKRPGDLGIEIRPRFLHQPLAQLVAQHAALDLQHVPFRQFVELERTVGNADQPRDLEAEGAENVPHLAVLALAQRQRQPGIGALLPVERRFHRAVEDAVDGDPFAQAFERTLLHLAVHAHPVATQPAGGRQFEHAGKAAVIGEQQQPLGVDVQPADGHQPRQIGRQDVEDGLAPFRIAVGGDHARRLVEQEQPRALDGRDLHAVEMDDVVRHDVEGGRGKHLAVDPDAAGGNQFLGVAARGKAGPRQPLGDPLAGLRLYGCGARPRFEPARGVRLRTIAAAVALEIAPGSIKTPFGTFAVSRYRPLATRRIRLARPVALHERFLFRTRPLAERPVGPARLVAVAGLVFAPEFGARALPFPGLARNKIPLRPLAFGSHRTLATRRIGLARPVALHERLLGAEGRLAAAPALRLAIRTAPARPHRFRAALARVFLVVVVHGGLCPLARLQPIA